MEFVISLCFAGLCIIFAKGINFISSDLIDIKNAIKELTQAIKDNNSAQRKEEQN